MADPYRDTDSSDRTGLPRWAKLAGIAVAVLVLLVVVMMLAGGGGGGGHNPPSHGGDGGGGGGTTPAVSESGSGVPSGHTPPPGSHG